MPDHDELDRMLDSALSTYAAPSRGFEERLLRSMASIPGAVRMRRRRWLLWALALPAAACLILAIFVLQPRRPSQAAGVQRARKQATITRAVPGLRPEVSPLHVARQNQRKNSSHLTLSASAAPLPKLDVFPTPQPLTSEEKVLVETASGNPTAEREALLQSNAPVTPLDIASLKIPPLVVSDEGKHMTR